VRETWKPNRKLQIKEKKNQDSCADKNVVLQFLPPTKFLLILSSINFFILAPFPFGHWSKKRASNWPAIGLQTLSILQLCPANSGKNPSRGRNPCFHTRYSNGNILSFWYRNQAIQKPKFIYMSGTTTWIRSEIKSF
jgi:hypothetical protein